jgi:4-aminobutyrate aminotransferase-like enzyme
LPAVVLDRAILPSIHCIILNFLLSLRWDKIAAARRSILSEISMVSQPNSLAGRDVATVIHPYTNLEQHKMVGPTVIARGEGVYVYDDSGKKYLEGMAGLWSTSLGFSEKRLVEAAVRQMEKLPTYTSSTGDRTRR